MLAPLRSSSVLGHQKERRGEGDLTSPPLIPTRPSHFNWVSFSSSTTCFSSALVSFRGFRLWFYQCLHIARVFTEESKWTALDPVSLSTLSLGPLLTDATGCNDLHIRVHLTLLDSGPMFYILYFVVLRSLSMAWWQKFNVNDKCWSSKWTGHIGASTLGG